jgi:hypothetical protein
MGNIRKVGILALLLFLLLSLFKWDSQSDAAASRWVLTTHAIGKTEYKTSEQAQKKDQNLHSSWKNTNSEAQFERTISETCAAEISGTKKNNNKKTQNHEGRLWQSSRLGLF